MINKSQYTIGIKQIRKHYPYGELIPEADRPWCYLAFDNGPLGSGELIFSEFRNYRCYFSSVESAFNYWESNKHTIYVNWDLYDKSTISIQEIIMQHAKMLTF